MVLEFIAGPLECTDEVNLIQLMWTEWNHVYCTCSICLLNYQYVCAIQATLNSFPNLHFSKLICCGIYSVVWYTYMYSSGRIKYVSEWSYGAVCI